MSKKILTDEQDRWIFEHHIGVGTVQLTCEFNKVFGTSFTVSQMKSYKARNKLNSGLTGRFEKGHVPINKGTKGLFNVGGNKTSFKKGILPLNTDPIGTEKMLSDGICVGKSKRCSQRSEDSKPEAEACVIVGAGQWFCCSKSCHHIS